MRWLHRLVFKLKNLAARGRKEAELAEELRAHVEMQTEANIAAGMDPGEARTAALRKLGGVEQAREYCRDEFAIQWLETLVRDVRHGVRVLRKSPGFTGVAIATLALGIGASTAVFSVVEAVLLRPLPYRSPGELVNVDFELSRAGTTNVGCSVPELDDLRERSGVFAEISMVFPMDGNLTGVAEPQRVEAMAVSPSYFRVLGIAPALGRTFGAEEESVSGWAQGCVLSHKAWMTHFGGDPHVLGRKFYMDYDTFRVVGVMPPEFRHPGRTLAAEVDVWFTGGMRAPPFAPEPVRGYRLIPGVIGRLVPGLTPAQAQEKLAAFAARTRHDFPRDYVESERWMPRASSLQDKLVGDVRGVLWLFLAAVLLVLLICCATIANLMLVRAVGRRQEMAVRSALGASRVTIVRQLVIESLLLAGAGGLGGLIVAWVLPPVLLAYAPASVPRLNALAVNGHVLGFALLASGLTGLVFGMLPALRASKFDLIPDLKAGSRTAGAEPSAQRWRSALVAAQIALSLVLLAGAGLLLRSFLSAWHTNPGFDPHQVLTGRIWLPPPSDAKARQTYHDHGNRVTLIRELERRFSALPAVQSVAIATAVPLTASSWSTPIRVDGAEADTAAVAQVTSVSPDYFRTLRISLLRGRVFTDSDDGRDPVAIINAAAAARYWPGQDPIGRRLSCGTEADAPQCTIVGVVGNAKDGPLDTPDQAHVYRPVYQDSWLALAFFVRAEGAPATLTQALRREIHGADADLPIYQVLTMEQLMARSLVRRRFMAGVVGVFAGFSLLLAGVGIYGVIALTVTQRTREIGVRIALGASRHRISAMVLNHGLTIAAIGMAAGSLGGVAATLAMREMLFQTHPLDPLTWLSIVLLLFAVAALACWLPARRASATDPMIALRSD
ncbi:MAG TPA: ABC transporter permease [Opitutaceae bacterium]|nr:ABC transporter permease [Opitutaceae bacterium]